MVDAFDFFTIQNAIRLLIFVFAFGYCIFSLLLMLRIRILAETLKTPKSPLMVALAKIHVLMVVIGSILVGILILF